MPGSCKEKMVVKGIVAATPIIISFIALYVSLHDRRPRLKLQVRKGDWYKLKPTLDRRDFVFLGVLEVYNASSRGNAIKGYEFWAKEKEGDEWQVLESEFYKETNRESETASNVTPLGLTPYSGVEARVMAIGKGPLAVNEMIVRVKIKDLFGSDYETVARAYR